MSKRKVNPNLIHCPCCGSVIAEKDGHAGIKLHCSKCGAPLKVVVTADSHVTVMEMSRE